MLGRLSGSSAEMDGIATAAARRSIYNFLRSSMYAKSFSAEMSVGDDMMVILIRSFECQGYGLFDRVGSVVMRATKKEEDIFSLVDVMMILHGRLLRTNRDMVYDIWCMVRNVCV